MPPSPRIASRRYLPARVRPMSGWLGEALSSCRDPALDNRAPPRIGRASRFERAAHFTVRTARSKAKALWVPARATSFAAAERNDRRLAKDPLRLRPSG